MKAPIDKELRRRLKELNVLSPESLAYLERVHVVLLALDEFYEPQEAIAWLLSQQTLMDNDRPSELLRTPGGFQRVKECLARLRDGAYI